MSKFLRLLILVPFLVSGPALVERTEEDVRAELEAVQKQIKELQEERRKRGQQLSKAEQALQKAERSEQKARSELTQARNSLRSTRKRYDELLAEQRKAQQSLASQQADLALQMRLAYMQGQEQYMKMLLSLKRAIDYHKRVSAEADGLKI